MADINNMTLTGRLVRDAELKYFPSGAPYLLFSVANNTGYANYAKANFFNCKLVGKSAESLAKYMLKGQFIGLSGELTTDEWTGRDGAKHKDWTLTTTQVNLLGGKKEDQQPSHKPAEKEEYPNPPMPGEDYENNIPF